MTQGRHGVRVVAALEAAKGFVVLLAGFGVIGLVHRGLEPVADELVRHTHLNLASRYPRIFLDLLENLSDQRLRGLAALAFGYAALRFIEAYGLWRERRWAEWFGVACGGIYVPFELYELAEGVSWLKLSTLAINLAVVGYLGYALWLSRRLSPQPVASSLK
ncbi:MULTISPECIES: DUF2127 domain-containing protein [Methylococcus]|uniref:DUF2127 domain-containing protein n=1 Tax=Methylococcus capsulatus TaxID=414 RepID=A0ABZ2FAG9_METCP|nr:MULTISPECIES: DUF2127 domain-containing protein [Methylococcus]MDF9392668.1 DUF2127 domain-containing protein [Methylococcus capsulatus]